MSDKKTFNEWERELGCLVIGTPESHLADKMSRKEFEAEVYGDGKMPHGVNWADRTEFLTSNGYVVNRKNMVDHSLSHKPVEPKK